MINEEFAIIVDQDDTVIEYRNRRKVGTFDLHRIAAVWIVNEKQEVLLAQRAHTMRNQPSVWGPAAAGTVAQGEEYIDTAYRELEEEIGLREVALTQKGKFWTDKDFGECRMCAVFTGTYSGPLSKLRLQKEEVAAVKWVNLADLTADLSKTPQNYVINLAQVIECL